MFVFKLTAKQNVCGKLPKGATFQVIEKAASYPQSKTITEAIKQQLGIELNSSSVHREYFTVERIK